MCLPMPAQPSPGLATAGRVAASRHSRRGRCRTGRHRRSSHPRMTSMVAVCLCGSIRMTTRAVVEPMRPSDARSSPVSSREGNAASSRANPRLSLSRAQATPGPRRPNESHTPSVGSRNESDEPGAWTEPRQVRSQSQCNKQPRSALSVVWRRSIWYPCVSVGVTLRMWADTCREHVCSISLPPPLSRCSTPSGCGHGC
jgi:hypothetical protein